MNEPLTGTIKITRLGADAIIEIRDDASREVFLRIQMKDFDLMDGANNGRSQPALLDLQNLHRVGMEMQTKVLHVSRPKLMRGRHTITDAQWYKAMSEHEEHGWRGSLADCRNPQRAVFGDAQAVTFTRYVHPRDIKPCRKN